MYNLAIISQAPDRKRPRGNVTGGELSGHRPIPEYPGFILLPMKAIDGPGICCFIKTRASRELEVYRPHPHRVCGHDGRWARAADSGRLTGLPSSSHKGQYRCLSTALTSSTPAQPLSHWYLPQTQHTSNKFLICNTTCLSQHPYLDDTPPRFSGQKPRVTFNSTLHSAVPAGSSQQHSP